MNIYYQVRLTDQLLTLRMLLDDCTTHSGQTLIHIIYMRAYKYMVHVLAHMYGTFICAHIFTHIHVYCQVRLTDQLLTLHMLLDDCTTHAGHALIHIIYMRAYILINTHHVHAHIYLHVYGTCTCARIFIYVNMSHQVRLTDQLLTFQMVLDDCTTPDTRTQVKIYMYQNIHVPYIYMYTHVNTYHVHAHM